MMHSRVYLSLLGQAIADAYGVRFECMTAEAIKASFVTPPLKSLGGGPFHFAAGSFSDDTEMAILTLYSLMQKGCVDTEHLKMLYRTWALHANDVGIQTQKALLGGVISPDAEGNGALMRILPSVAYMHLEWHQEPLFIKEAIQKISALTHDTPNIHAINNFFIDLLLEEDLSEHTTLIKTFLQTTGASGWVMNTARIVYQTFLKKELTFLEGLWEIISYGGDTDTACAIYGALRIYRTPPLLFFLHVSDFLSEESQEVLRVFSETHLHYYQPEPSRFPTLYAGQYPGSKHTVLHSIKLGQLIEREIDCVISLMEAEETSFFTPYTKALKQANPRIELLQFPIQDMKVPTQKQCETIVEAIEEMLTCNKKVYIHCWGGHGRTGTIIGAWLVAQGYHPKDALDTIKSQRKQTRFEDQPSPQTSEQVEFVYNFISTLSSRGRK